VREAAIRRQVGRALNRLEEVFGRPRLGRRYPPLDELVLTILSQNTNDRNRDRAYASLRRRYPTWKRVLAAPPSGVENAIRTGGLAHTKSRVIQAVLRHLQAERGTLGLDFLRRLPVEEARRFLSSFKGVGEKTVNCVLLFACGRPAFPVDTHIHRVSRRIGWVPSRATRARTHEAMAMLVPESHCLSGHVNLITLGRRYCRPTSPACPVCPLRRYCRHGARRMRSGRGRSEH
jgi:endonuclease-3